ncbi:MAG: glycoside hydrolase family 3 protein [Muribaculaceae bacterium]|nr:glycoside hydrolase family 3 protein [Muribaculaceae bacterium]
MKKPVITFMTLLPLCSGTLADNVKNEIRFEQKDGYVLVHQTNGPDLGYSPESGVKIIERDGFAFKSYDGTDSLLPYADWRMPAEERAADLARRLSIDEIAGLMLYSTQNKLPMPNDTYGGKTFAESGAKAWEISDGQRKYLLDDNVRHLLVSTVDSPEAAARWNNNVQALIEGSNHGIPANNSSDPRHSAFQDAEFAPGAGGQLSMWSNLMGLAATFDPAVMRRFAEIASEEYRALGLATALSPQADLGTDPRWYRFNSTFGNDPQLVCELIREYCDGFQSSSTADSGWGNGSVNAMVKHWPGGGSGEGGRDAHYGNGKFAVYPGGCMAQHIYPFTGGAFNLEGKTGKASAVMPYYTVSFNQTSENVGNSFNKELITDSLRNKYGYDGVVCTDWVITDDPVDPGKHWSKPWGVENLTVAERHYKALMAGVDQFGGNNEKGPVIEAYEIGCAEHGEPWMRSRMERSAARLLLNSFRPGLFENPYVDVEQTVAKVGKPEWMAEGYAQQLKSIIMLKNHNALLPAQKGLKVYIPNRKVPAMRNFWGGTDPARDYQPFEPSLVNKYFSLVDTPQLADFAIVFMESPKSWRMGYDPADKEAGGNGYIPISLQYRPYTASTAREHSIACDPWESDRSYKGKSVYSMNECELDLLEDVRKQMGDKPVIVIMGMNNPTVMKEVEPLADAILIGFNVQNQAFFDIITGEAEPSALLPFELPASMEAVEQHCEDRPHDIEPYTDCDGNRYGFGYGRNFSGIIKDWRTEKYAK